MTANNPFIVQAPSGLRPKPVEAPRTSATFDYAVMKLAEANNISIEEVWQRPDLLAQAKDYEARSVFGFDAKKDRNGNYIPQGLGSASNRTINHFNAIRRWEGEQSYWKNVRKAWANDPQQCERIGLPKPERASA